MYVKIAERCGFRVCDRVFGPRWNESSESSRGKTESAPPVGVSDSSLILNRFHVRACVLG
jgi:hypothetical protein